MSLTPEQFDALLRALRTSDGANSSILVFTGIIAMAGLLLVVWFIINMRMKPVDNLEKQLDNIHELLTDLTSKMWTTENLENKVRVIVQEHIGKHENSCPYRKTR